MPKLLAQSLLLKKKKLVAVDKFSIKHFLELGVRRCKHS
jgi:hypothetical protein